MNQRKEQEEERHKKKRSNRQCIYIIMNTNTPHATNMNTILFIFLPNRVARSMFEQICHSANEQTQQRMTQKLFNNNNARGENTELLSHMDEYKTTTKKRRRNGKRIIFFQKQ